jgi:hypothetical protein
MSIPSLQNFLGEGLQNGLGFELKAESFHPADQSSLAMANASEPRGDLIVAPAEYRPVAQFVDRGWHSPRLMRSLSRFARPYNLNRRITCRE